MNGRFFGIMFVRPHAKRAAGNEHHGFCFWNNFLLHNKKIEHDPVSLLAAAMAASSMTIARNQAGFPAS
jgi:hypothetical protein